MRNRGKKDSEDIWADPEAILRPTEGERLTSIIEDFENERYPQMMALGWVNQVLERLPENQAVLRELLNQSRVELSSLVIAMNIGMDWAHQMLSECTGEPVQTSSSLSPKEALGEEQTRQLA